MLFDVSDVGGTGASKYLYTENLVVFVVLAEMFPHKLNEQFAHICFHILALWWVES